MLLTVSGANFESVLRDLWSKYGPPDDSPRLPPDCHGWRPRSRPRDPRPARGRLCRSTFPLPALRLLTSNQGSIITARYGPLWRVLRRNLATEILNPSRVRQWADTREWVLHETFQYAMFSLLVFLCIGEKLEEAAVREIEAVQRDVVRFFGNFSVFEFTPKITRYLFRGEGDLPHSDQISAPTEGIWCSWGEQLPLLLLGFLLDLEILEEKGRKLNDEEIIALFSEFVTTGTSTTSALEWIMANVVKHPIVQERLAEEVGANTKEDDLQKKPYLKAVVLEGLRCHPPAQLPFPRATTDEISLGGYTIPKGTSVGFAVVKMHLDGETWPDPLEFRPERFLPAARGRDLPGMSLALLHLEFFVANLVGEFRWEAAGGGEVDLTEKIEVSAVMRNPLRARISSRH
ncbi:unnamed protein product [Spirodela intermedia]|uniref:Uncharacterized protein n=1 Tax=Spirodela intermedia TaxID=51605 RepID=A0A7I8JJ49_SPIIN|nr:unnamed protein product [Spirodela intermedia]CAA6670198.1 unnamed protein product [Spirodela intermedia]